MPFISKAQQRFLESSGSPLTEDQKKEFEASTDFKNLPERKTTHYKHVSKIGTICLHKSCKKHTIDLDPTEEFHHKRRWRKSKCKECGGSKSRIMPTLMSEMS